MRTRGAAAGNPGRQRRALLAPEALGPKCNLKPASAVVISVRAWFKTNPCHPTIRRRAPKARRQSRFARKISLFSPTLLPCPRFQPHPTRKPGSQESRIKSTRRKSSKDGPALSARPAFLAEMQLVSAHGRHDREISASAKRHTDPATASLDKGGLISRRGGGSHTT